MRSDADVDALTFRRAGADDAGGLGVVMAEGFETYRAFAPAGWTPPTAEQMAEIIAPRLATTTAWCLLAERDSHVAGYVALVPATETRRPVDDPRLAHLWMLFVSAPWWGSGLATRLHTDACAAAAARGFTAMRLFTPAGQDRARRFYEREGWWLTGGPYVDEEIGFSVVEYRRALTPAPG